MLVKRRQLQTLNRYKSHNVHTDTQNNQSSYSSACTSNKMFNFIKKGVSVGERDREKTDREKDRRKKEKKQRKDITKQNILGTMSSEELLRLDEVNENN